jgi:hypothetical protein
VLDLNVNLKEGENNEMFLILVIVSCLFKISSKMDCF